MKKSNKTKQNKKRNNKMRKKNDFNWIVKCIPFFNSILNYIHHKQPIFVWFKYFYSDNCILFSLTNFCYPISKRLDLTQFDAMLKIRKSFVFCVWIYTQQFLIAILGNFFSHNRIFHSMHDQSRKWEIFWYLNTLKHVSAESNNSFQMGSIIESRIESHGGTLTKSPNKNFITNFFTLFLNNMRNLLAALFDVLEIIFFFLITCETMNC